MNKTITQRMATDIETSLMDINCAASVLSLLLEAMGSEQYTEDDRNVVYSVIKLVNPAINKLTAIQEQL